MEAEPYRTAHHQIGKLVDILGPELFDFYASLANNAAIRESELSEEEELAKNASVLKRRIEEYAELVKEKTILTMIENTFPEVKSVLVAILQTRNPIGEEDGLDGIVQPFIVRALSLSV